MSKTPVLKQKRAPRGPKNIAHGASRGLAQHNSKAPKKGRTQPPAVHIIPIPLTTEVQPGVYHYAFDVVGDPSSTTLQFSYGDDGSGMILDNVNVNPETGPATASTSGAISFSDVETADG